MVLRTARVRSGVPHCHDGSRIARQPFTSRAAREAAASAACASDIKEQSPHGPASLSSQLGLISGRSGRGDIVPVPPQAQRKCDEQSPEHDRIGSDSPDEPQCAGSRGDK
jgi:hypothetical protein